MEPYAFRDVMYKKLIELCIDICKRNGKDNLIWFGDKDKTLNYSPKSGEMILTVHRWFANKSCPGSWMYARVDRAGVHGEVIKIRLMEIMVVSVSRFF